MKCDKLEIKYVGYGMGFYPTEDVDAAIAELKDENRRLKRALWLARALKANAEQSWSAYIKYVHVHEKSFYVFDGDDIFCRYNRNNDSFKGWYHRWMSVERKCRAKAEEYK